MDIKIYAFNDETQVLVKQGVIQSKGYRTEIHDLNSGKLAIDLTGINNTLNIYTANYLLIAIKWTTATLIGAGLRGKSLTWVRYINHALWVVPTFNRLADFYQTHEY